MIRTLLILVNIVLIACMSLVVIPGQLNSLALSYAYATEAITGFAVLSLVGALVLLLVNQNASKHATLLLGLLCIVSLSAHLTMDRATGLVTTSPLYPLYAAVIFLYAGLGNARGWLVSALMLLILETGGLVYLLREQSLEAFQTLMKHFGAAMAMSLLPFTAALSVRRHSRVNQVPQPMPRTMPRPNNTQALTPTAADTRITQLSRADAAAETGVFALSRFQQSEPLEGAAVDGLLEGIVYFAQKNFDAFSALGFIYEPQRQQFVLNAYRSRSMNIIKNVRIPLGKGIVGKIGTEKHSFMSGDLSAYGQELFYYSGTEFVNSLLAVPVISEDKELVGALVVDSKSSRFFSDNHKDAMRRFSTLAAALITNTRMRLRQQRTAQQFKIFYETSQKFTTALTVQEVYNILLDMTGQLTRFVRAMVITPDRERSVARISKILGDASVLHEGFEFPLNSGLSSFAILKGKTVHIGDLNVYTQKYYRYVPNEPRSDGVRSILMIPFVDDEGGCRGLLSVESDIPNQYHGELEQLLSTLAGNASVAMTRAMLYQQMEHLATTDGLTGLSNHRFFQELLTNELARSARYNRPLSLLLMDIDHFKKFNDTYGHPVGDQVLREIARCIKSSLRANDFPARYGGEEFAVILPETSEQSALVTAERIRQTVENHRVQSGENQLKVTVSIGCAAFPQVAQEKADLINCADKALYMSKEGGRNRVTPFRGG